ncbi:MAG: recombinase family protein [Anaerotignum sp.]|nr:recombinase family protein [Anaerotignum sp.]MBR5121927.1 recombinase family protein [Anaerotignum sp.]
MKIAVTYMRMSTDQQEHSIESQERLIKAYAKQNGYTIMHNYVDEGISGRNAEKRPQFLQMIDDSSKGDFQYVIIYDSSRFARNLEQSLVYKSMLKKNGVTLVSITEPVLDDDTSLITDALFGAMNEMYSRKLSKNVKRGMEQKALRGEFCGNIPFGYDYDKEKKQLVPNPSEAPIAKYVLAEILSGRTPYSISKEMREKNIRTKAGITLERRRIEYMIRNPVYKGYIRWSVDGGEIVQKSTHEPFITEEEFDEIQKITEERAIRLRKNSKPAERCSHWLSGTIYCSECNCTYTYVKAREHENKKARFRCSGQSRGRCSSGSSFRIDVLENLVLQILNETITSDDVLYSMRIHKSPAPQVDYEAEIKKLQISLDRAKKAFLAGVDTLEEYGENKTRISSEIENLQKLQNSQTEKEINIDEFRERIITLIDILNSDADAEVKKNAFRSHVEKIIIEKNTKNIRFYFFA